jgi:hypothetical protein
MTKSIIIKRNAFALLVLSMVALTSCKTHFTGGMKKKLETEKVDLNKIQFYNSAKIVLTRVLLDSESDVIDGKIKLEDGKRIQEIVLKKNTPGALHKADPDFLDLYFETGENRNLRFEYKDGRDYFRLPEISGRDSLLYEDKWFKVMFPSIPKVKVKKNDFSKTIKESRKIKGVKITK